MAAALFLVTFVAQPFVVQGSSMEPSLHEGERVIVSKLTYRWGMPTRGDVVVFRYPANRRLRFIKRVVGLPGETVAIKDGQVLIDGRPLKEDYLCDLTLGEFGPARVPAGHLFLLGDNRANSRDSRYPEVGMVAYRDVIGKAVVVYWPPMLMGRIGGS
ncbi:MAG TPA: signal peptidase I [Firmicutes bacterium]|nr:signal peptidase I [Bacillota bacterium]